MIYEYDVVRSTKMLSEKIPRGTLGTVLLVYSSLITNYEVEFKNELGETLGILTVTGSDIEKIGTE